MTDSENKTVHFQYKISCMNINVTVIGMTHWIIIHAIIDFIHSHRHVRWQRFYQKIIWTRRAVIIVILQCSVLIRLVTRILVITVVVWPIVRLLCWKLHPRDCVYQQNARKNYQSTIYALRKQQQQSDRIRT